MTYNEADIARRIKIRKRDFLIKLLCWTLLAVIAGAVCAIFQEVTVIFICVLTIVISLVYIIRTLRRYRPRILFSREIRGINIKEHEFFVSNRRMAFAARRIMPRIKSSGYTGARTRTKPPTSAIVYLRLADGEVTYIDGLTNAQTDIYEIGDTLYKYAGTRYPVIPDREVSVQPCPLCGTANKIAENQCITCGLKIDK